MYQQFIKPIAHRGGAEPVTADELRNCLSQVAAVLGSPCPVEDLPHQEQNDDPAPVVDVPETESESEVQVDLTADDVPETVEEEPAI